MTERRRATASLPLTGDKTNRRALAAFTLPNVTPLHAQAGGEDLAAPTPWVVLWLGQAAPPRPWTGKRPNTVSPFSISFSKLKIIENLFKILKSMENEIKLGKYKRNFLRIQQSVSLRWARPNSFLFIIAV
jgi:hypothetical protein